MENAMKEARARLSKDHPVIGEGVPMTSSSQKAIAIGDVLYTGTAGVSGYRDHELKTEFSVTSWRVIQINYKERYYRIRNEEGCEESIHHGESGCPRMRVFHDFKDLQKVLLRAFERETQKTETKIHARKSLLRDIESDRGTIDSMKAPDAPALVEFGFDAE